MTQTQRNEAGETIRAMAERHGVTYRERATDVLGNAFTRLSGDDVELDGTELLLVELQRSGHIEGHDAVRLHAEYLRALKT